MKYTIELTADTKGLQPGVDALEQIGTVSKENAEQFKKTNEELKKINSSVDELSKGFKETSQAAAGAFGGEAIKDAVKASASFRTQLRQSRDELVQMMQSGKANTATLYAMAKGAGELKDQVTDAQAVIKVLSSDTFKLDAALQGIQVGAAGFQIMQGAAAAFGSENKELEKVLVKLNGVMAITQGLQQIQNALQQESAFRLGIQVAAQKAYNFVVGESVGIMRVFKIALAATGIGLAVIAIGALVANWDKFTKTVRESFPALDGVIKFFENFRQIAAGAIKSITAGFGQVGKIISDVFKGDFSGAYADAKKVGSIMAEAYNKGYAEKDEQIKRQAGIKDRKFRLDLAEAQGKDVRALRVKLLQDELKDLEKGSDEYNAKLIEIEKLRYEIRKDAAEKQKIILKNLKENLQEEFSIDIDLFPEKIQKNSKKYFDDIISRLERVIQNVEIGSDRWIYLNNQIALTKKLFDDLSQTEDQITQKSVESVSIIIDKTNEKLKNNNKLWWEGWEKNTSEQEKKEEEKEKAIKDASIQIAQETANAIFQIANQRRNNEFNSEIQRLNEAKDRELANKELTDNQKKRIEEKYAREIAAIKTKQAQADKAAAIAQAIVNGALAITKIFTTVTALNPAAYAAIAITAASTAAQVAIIAAQKIPKFAKGTEFVNGAGTATSDSIPAMLSKGERVVPAHINKLLNGIPNELLPEMLMPSKTFIGSNMDYDKMAKAFSKELASNPQLMVNFDKRGFETFIKNGNTIQQIKNNRNDF